MTTSVDLGGLIYFSGGSAKCLFYFNRFSVIPSTSHQNWTYKREQTKQNAQTSPCKIESGDPLKEWIQKKIVPNSLTKIQNLKSTCLEKEKIEIRKSF